ncbi:hypothetical protein [Shinella pollutisoli]|uniref:Phage DNA packaging protein, Nu1 subunit of terminase n=1 Tax=Shinella pollutisoli TaxID=2250594 RepID=A0ABV7DH45_9HYPH|nr:hypothetical protein [Shinella pollutisoli]
MTNPNTPAGSVSAQQLAALLMISTGRVRQLAQAGIIPKAGRDAYPMVAGIRGYLRWLQDEGRRAAQAASAAKVASARATEIEQRIAQKMRELIPLEDHRQVMGSLVRVVRREVEKVPAALPSYIRNEVRAEIDQMMGRIEKAAADAQKSAELGEDFYK